LDVTTPVKDLKSNYSTKIYPNPFTDRVKIAYYLPEDKKSVTISVFSQKGSEVVKFIHCPTAAGQQVIDWRADGLAPGYYLYRLQITDGSNSTNEVSGILVKTE